MYKRILVPIDGGRLSERSIEASIELAGQLGAAIVGFAVEPLASSFRGRRNRDEVSDEQDSEELSGPAGLRQALALFEDRARVAGVPYEGYCHQASRVDRAILAAAESHSCDMILMVTHGRGPFGEFLFGSQTKAVLAGSKLPLMVLK